MRLNGIDATVLSNSELDAAYAAYFNAGDVKNAVPYAVEIIERQATAGSFVFNLFGQSKFPLFDAIQAARGGFVGTDAAQTAVKQSAARVGQQVITGAKWALGGTATILTLGVAAFLLLKFGRRK